MESTLTEIQAAESEKRERARIYESLLNSRITLQATVKRLETTAVDLTPLRTIFELCGSVPQNIVTRGSSSELGHGFGVPGGLVARDVLMDVAGNALRVAERKEQERLADLTNARNALAEVERQLRDDFNE